MQLSKLPKPKATRKRLKKEILSDDFKKRKIFYGKFSTSHHYLWETVVTPRGFSSVTTL
jgi:hypothetical protein